MQKAGRWIPAGALEVRGSEPFGFGLFVEVFDQLRSAGVGGGAIAQIPGGTVGGQRGAYKGGHVAVHTPVEVGDWQVASPIAMPPMAATMLRSSRGTAAVSETL